MRMLNASTSTTLATPTPPPRPQPDADRRLPRAPAASASGIANAAGCAGPERDAPPRPPWARNRAHLVVPARRSPQSAERVVEAGVAAWRHRPELVPLFHSCRLPLRPRNRRPARRTSLPPARSWRPRGVERAFAPRRFRETFRTVKLDRIPLPHARNNAVEDLRPLLLLQSRTHANRVCRVQINVGLS
jgi:hypothetical protein